MHLIWAIQIAETQRKLHKYNLLDKDITAIEFALLDAAENAQERAESEMYDSGEDESRNKIGLGEGSPDSVL